jgi:hypothetical protein
MPTSTQPSPSHACVLVVPPLLQGASIIRPGKQQSRRAGSPSTTRSLRVALARNTLCVVLVWVSMAGGCRQQPAARRMAGGSSLLLAALAKGPAAGGDGDIDWRGGVFQPCADVRQNLRTPLVWVSMAGGCWQQPALRRMAGAAVSFQPRPRRCGRWRQWRHRLTRWHVPAVCRSVCQNLCGATRVLAAIFVCSLSPDFCCALWPRFPFKGSIDGSRICLCVCVCVCALSPMCKKVRQFFAHIPTWTHTPVHTTTAVLTLPAITVSHHSQQTHS